MRRRLWIGLGFGILLVVALTLGAALGFFPSNEISRDRAEGTEASPITLPEHTPADEPVEPTLAGRAGRDAGPGGGVVPPPVDLARVNRGRDLHGVVVRKDGAPVPGALLQVVTHPWQHADLLTDGLHDVTFDGPSSRSATDGTFALRLRPGELVALRVLASGLAPVELPELQAGERVRVVLEEPVRLRVRARTEDGEPVEGVALRLFRLGGGGRTLEGVTDASGECLFADLVPKRALMLDPTPKRHGSPGWLDLVLPASGERVYDLVLPAGRTLTGRVTDVQTGLPIAGARVGMNWTLSPEVRTDAKGRYVLPGWTEQGVQDVHVLAVGYGREERRVGSLEVVDFDLRRGHRVVGRILDIRDRPLANAQVSAVGSVRVAGDQRISTDATRTDLQGRFELQGLRTDMPHTLIAMAPGYGRTLLDFDPPPSEEGNEEGVVDVGDLRLPGALSISGVVVDAAGDPLPRVRVSLTGANTDRARLRSGTPAQTFYGVGLQRRTDDLGRFLFADLSAGRYGIRVRPAGGLDVAREIELGSEDLTGVRIALSATREVLVRVVDEDGTPVPGCWVQAQGSGPNRASVRADENGEARLTLTPGTVRITAYPWKRRDLLLPRPHVLQDDEDQVTIVLRTAALVSGRVVDPEGRRVPGATLEARRGSERVAYAQSDDEGEFQFRLPPGDPVDVVYDGWSPAARRTVRSDPDWPWSEFAGRVDGVRAGQTDVVLVVRPIVADRHVVVRVLDPSGLPVAGVTVRVGPSSTAAGKTDRDGRLRLEGLRPQAVQLRVHVHWTRERPWIAPDSTVVPEGQEVAIRLRMASTVSGRVLVEGRPLPPWTRLELLRPDGSTVLRGGAGREGVFRQSFDSADRGPFTLRATAAGADGSPLEGRIDGVMPNDTGLEILLEPPSDR